MLGGRRFDGNLHIDSVPHIQNIPSYERALLDKFDDSSQAVPTTEPAATAKYTTKFNQVKNRHVHRARSRSIIPFARDPAGTGCRVITIRKLCVTKGWHRKRKQGLLGSHMRSQPWHKLKTTLPLQPTKPSKHVPGATP